MKNDNQERVDEPQHHLLLEGINSLVIMAQVQVRCTKVIVDELARSS
jgi:hypothetical protein